MTSHIAVIRIRLQKTIPPDPRRELGKIDSA
jgi:hypothetical protein